MVSGKGAGVPGVGNDHDKFHDVLAVNEVLLDALHHVIEGERAPRTATPRHGEEGRGAGGLSL